MAYLKAENAIFSQTPGHKSGVTLRPKQKFALIRRVGMDVDKLAAIASVSRSGYYKWLEHADRPEKDHADYLRIKAVFDNGRLAAHPDEGRICPQLKT